MIHDDGRNSNQDRTYSFDHSVSLFKRALNVIPGGIYGSKSPGFVVPGSYPYYFTRGKGCKLWDADGNEYIDYMCGYGSMILGYGYDLVDDPAIEQLRCGDLLTTPSPVMVELAERLTGLIEGMDWAVFAKNGTDMTTLAVSMARVKTGKKKIVMARGAYHGSANWCSSNDFPELEDKKDNLDFEYNNIEELKNLFSRYQGEIAGILLTPYHHPAWADSVMPSEGLYSTVEKLCGEENALFIMDDIRTNFRLDIRGSHRHVGCKPDLITMGKSLANGYPIAVLMGTGEQKKTAGSFFITGTFWYSAVPMIAAMKALDEMERLDVIGHMNRVGTMLKEGLTSLGKDFGFEIFITGAPAIPFMTFKDDPDLFSNQVFCSEMTKRGIYLHPHHNWFLSYAHREEHIHQTLETAKIAFREVEKSRV